MSQGYLNSTLDFGVFESREVRVVKVQSKKTKYGKREKPHKWKALAFEGKPGQARRKKPSGEKELFKDSRWSKRDNSFVCSIFCFESLETDWLVKNNERKNLCCDECLR
mmetsp:Transcript_38481/g.53597  ORF Transcript_38481/g.53597 Transcript_38481/m.53597 type:complete len:109 (+) Transcript_38481:378-704(+)